MPPKAHATLSASSAERWIHCPPSARLAELYEDRGSDFSAEGTDAHALCEYRLLTALGREAEDPTESLTWYSDEMSDCADGYAAFVMEQVHQASDPIVLVEQRVDFSQWVREGFGTADCIIIDDGTLTVIDYKHGLGVEVSAHDNPQMKCYALGALVLSGALYDISNVRMIIYQPRRENISQFSLSTDDLYKWADEVLKPKAELAFAGKGNFQCGEWCTFCKAKQECRARAMTNLKLADYGMKKPPLLEDREIEEILGKIDSLVSWAKDVKEYAVNEAVSGKSWTGWKLVEGRSVRKYRDENAVADIVKKEGLNPYENKLIGITAMQKLLGKTRFEEILGEYIEKPAGAPTLVKQEDFKS